MTNKYADHGSAISYVRPPEGNALCGALVVVPKHQDYPEYVDFMAQHGLLEANATALDLLASGEAIPQEIIDHRDALKGIIADPHAAVAAKMKVPAMPDMVAIRAKKAAKVG